MGPRRRVRKVPRAVPNVRRAGVGCRLVHFLLGPIIRIVTWAVLINVIFRCPRSLADCEPESPLFCRQYFHVKNTVIPVLAPYYDSHVAPVVELATPYYRTVDQVAIKPVRAYAVNYAKPRALIAKAIFQTIWRHKVAPLAERAGNAVRNEYSFYWGPHIRKLQSVATPVVFSTKTVLLGFYRNVVSPTYSFLEPRVIRACHFVATFASQTAVPSVWWALEKAYAFLRKHVAPHIISFYAEAIEPQLVRIGKRLGRHSGSWRNKKNLGEDVAMKGGDASSGAGSDATSVPTGKRRPSSSYFSTGAAGREEAHKQRAPSKSTPGGSGGNGGNSAGDGDSDGSVSSRRSRGSSGDGTEGESSSTSYDADSDARRGGEAPVRRKLMVNPPARQAKESETRKAARLEVTADLESWQEKFMKAAETGAAEIEERIVDICGEMRRQHVDHVGPAIVQRLAQGLESDLAKVEGEVRAILDKSPDGGDDVEEQVAQVVRKAGISLKERAQEIREWRTKFIGEVQAAITNAARSHFKLIDDIRDLAIQKIGMKWAWMDGVTYKDWKLFHSLKSEFSRWRDRLEIQVVDHASLASVTGAADDLENQGMEYAMKAALRLKRLRSAETRKSAAFGESTGPTNDDDGTAGMSDLPGDGNRGPGEDDADPGAESGHDEKARPRKEATYHPISSEADRQAETSRPKHGDEL